MRLIESLIGLQLISNTCRELADSFEEKRERAGKERSLTVIRKDLGSILWIADGTDRRVIYAITCNDVPPPPFAHIIPIVAVRDPRVRVQGRDNGRSLSARYWPIVAGEREPERALPSAARSDTGSYTAAVVTRPFSTNAASARRYRGTRRTYDNVYSECFAHAYASRNMLADKRCSARSVIRIQVYTVLS